MRLIQALLLLVAVSPAQVPSHSPSDDALRAVTQSAEKTAAHKYLEDLCDTIGGRLTGSEQDAKARRWAVDLMRRIGLEDVHEERWNIERAWTRISARAELRVPTQMQLTTTSQGWAGSTPQGGIEADVVEIDRNQLMQESRSSQRWRGKILLLVTKSKQADLLEAYRQFGPFLKLAKSAGAVAVIEADAAESSGRNVTHADLADITGSYSELPVVRMTPEHHAIVQRSVRKGRVRVWMDIQNRVSPGSVATANIVGQIRGTVRPQEVVLVGAHLDSWDLGQGAADDGFGVAAVLGAAAAIKQSALRPFRTVRFVLFTGEEQGIKGSQAYVKAHASEMRDHLAALISDMGDGPPVGLMLNGRDDLVSVVKQFQFPEPLRITDAAFLLGDSFSFTLAGIPAIDLEQKAGDFQHRRHSAIDTLDKVQPEHLNAATRVLAGVAFSLCARTERLSVPASADDVDRLLAKIGATPFLKLLNLSPPVPSQR